ncbi:hypothetical protein B9X49_19785 [Acinetobacter baumannii]|uniref:hypothetical protein n=3 Tax=Acinetobacter baumannii TaxID=470 RepID=UPI0003DF1D8F|nr:hypothetical protein [Acinetobacter baumannii]AVE45998.1 hypothetical protein AM435_09920 [Acinetobacter baumannii]AVN04372.1 hypothetical protein C7R87_0077 [Acinetobacter baumannii]EKU8013653.1 hypothetical protein [Acinetobacter baumannii]EKV2801915.1 hypothetical protein [Acinetobacter baumannii]ETQ01561.1 hypothetical protein P645_1083 [Acinetobacter baumannii UH10707]
MNSFTHQIKDSRQQSEIQSFYEPALRVLGHLFEVKKQNLRNKGYDENNAAVTRDEFMQGLVNDHGVHGINLYHAGVIISSLYRAKKIRYLGSFIQIIEGDGGA